MKYPTIRIEGAILAADILEKIEKGEITGQRPADFKIEGNFKVKDEIARAWADAKDYWRIFKRKKESLEKEERQTGTSETRSQWMIPFLGILGFKTEFARAEEVNGKSYAISHRDRSLDGFPIQIMGFKDSLDKKRQDSGPRMSPHALVQEYLNLTEHLFAIVTNGLQIRLLRDSSRLIKLSYIEFDLERMMEEEQYADFAILFRLLHYTRMPVNQDSVAESIIESYHQDSLESGSRIRDGLSDAVKKSILAFGNGFLQHDENRELIRWFEEGDKQQREIEFFQWQLRLIYRLLFLMVIEERDLIYPKNANRKHRKYYYDFYSINKLRRLSEKRYLADPRYTDYWQSVRNTFHLFENEKHGKPLGIAPLAGLFDEDQIGLLNDCFLDNQVIMTCLRNLSVFKNKNNNQVMRVNYAALNVEEFGSVYEKILEYDGIIRYKDDKLKFSMEKGAGRTRSGSHYTPDELVQPLIKHSLDYIIADKIKEKNPEEGLLSITVCDVACGSGHILLNAARRIATELAIIRTGEDQPSPSEIRKATREVIQRCIYGVDLNPLAVELCKVALWLEAHNPNEPLNFLDHHIKCGNAIVGLAHREELENGIANEAFKTLSGDDKKIAKAFLNKNKYERKERKAKETQLHTDFEQKTTANIQEALVEYEVFRKMPESSPEEISEKQKAYHKFLVRKGYMFLKTLCDIQVAQYFIPKTTENKDRLIADNEFRQILHGFANWQGKKTSYANVVSSDKRFFHWFLEFPEIFIKGGFDCILGNPPYLGGTKISSLYGKSTFNYLKSIYFPAAGRCDLIGYFVRQIFKLLKKDSFFALISTNTIAEGDTREGSLDIIAKDGEINFAIKSTRWPGEANVIVTLFSFIKGKWKHKYSLNNRLISKPINTYLTDDEILRNPNRLFANNGLVYMGSSVTGDGFLISSDDREKFIDEDIRNSDVIYPYLNGYQLNNSVDFKGKNYIINFWDMPEESAKEYKAPYERLLQTVKLEREQKSEEVRIAPWWQYWRIRKELYESLEDKKYALVQTRASKTHAFVFVEKDQIFSDALVVACLDSIADLGLLQSAVHESWAWQYSSKLKSDRRYSISDAFQTFPFPLHYESLTIPAKIYNDQRISLLNAMEIGLTKLHNMYHDLSCNENNIIELRKSAIVLDSETLKTYNWDDIALNHDFYAVDYLPENDNTRFTISPKARKEVLKRLLKLNHERYEEEIRMGLHDKGRGVKPKANRIKKKKVTSIAAESESPYKQQKLFENPNLFSSSDNSISEGSKVSIQKEKGKSFKYHISKNAVKGQFTGEYKQIKHSSPLAEVMLGRKEGDRFVFGGVGYVVTKIE